MAPGHVSTADIEFYKWKEERYCSSHIKRNRNFLQLNSEFQRNWNWKQLFANFPYYSEKYQWLSMLFFHGIIGVLLKHNLNNYKKTVIWMLTQIFVYYSIFVSNGLLSGGNDFYQPMKKPVIFVTIPISGENRNN